MKQNKLSNKFFIPLIGTTCDILRCVFNGSPQKYSKNVFHSQNITKRHGFLKSLQCFGLYKEFGLTSKEDWPSW